MLLALVTDPFRIFHQLFFQLLSSSQFPKVLTTKQHVPSSWMALPLQMPRHFTMTIKKYTSQFRIPETMFQYLPCRCLPSRLASPLSFVSISGTNQFLTIQKKLTTYFELPLLGLFQGLIPDHLVLLLFPLLHFFLLHLPHFLLLCLLFLFLLCFPLLLFLFDMLMGHC